MTDFLKLLKTRRSIRKFEDRPVDEETLNQLYEAVQWSQSWANTQCWEIIRVRDMEKRKALQEALGGRNPATKAVLSAPVLLAVCARKGTSGYYNGVAPTIYGDWMLFDLGIATQSLCLAAHSMGLGTVVVGLYDHARAAEVLELPDDYAQVALLPLGYPAQDPAPPKRKEISAFVREDRF